ncbi:MAG: penicillin acylase family protein [Caldilineaceae bacterium]
MMLNLLLTVAILLGLALLLFALFFFYLYYWLIQRAMPQLYGKVKLPGLQDQVEIRRDKFGIPHIAAQNRADLFRAQGFVHAQDRFWQMEQNRRIARGTLAEVFGEPALEADRFSRIIGFWRAAQAELAEMDGETRQILDWYAEGVNAYLNARPKRVAAEINLLRIQPEPWSALDTVGYSKVMAWGLSLNWESELTRLQLMQKFDPYVAAELEPDYPKKSPIILEGVSDDERLRAIQISGLLLNEYDKLREWLGQPGQGQGSNSWVVAPAKSLNGRPLLCNDPHLSISIPGVWYENHLTCPDYEVSGVSFPGTPGIVIGHNAQIAWGFTNAQVDVQDLYLERANPKAPTQFEYNGQWELAQVIEEVIQVRRGKPHVENVVITRHGPLIDGLIRQEDKKIGRQGDGANIAAIRNLHSPIPNLHFSLKWTGHQPSQTLRAMLKLNQAHNWEEFDTALADWHCPPQNVTFADKEGNIGYLLAGRVPVRDKNLGLVPAVGWTDEAEWSGTIPHTELPRLLNPSSGLIVTANNKMVGDDYPYFLGAEFYPGFRAARIEELLRERERFTIREMEEMQLDTGSKYAQALTPWIKLLQSDDPWEKAALQELRRWQYQMDGDSIAAMVFQATLIELLEMTFGDKLGAVKNSYLGISQTPLFLIHGFVTRAEVRLLELINDQERSPWYTDAKSGRQRSRDELLQEAFTRAVKWIRSDVSEVTSRWQWARQHQVLYAHPLGSARLVGRFFNRGPLTIGGSAYSPNVTRSAPTKPPGLVQVIASYRQVYEVGAWDRAESVLPLGQSGHPLSDHYDNQMIMWKEGTYHRMPWSIGEVEKVTEYKLVLSSA